MTSATTLMSDKSKRLKAGQALNWHPERVRTAWFQAGGFFDAQDLVQVKYEMLRHVQQDGASKAEAAALFGLSRPSFYQGGRGHRHRPRRSIPRRQSGLSPPQATGRRLSDSRRLAERTRRNSRVLGTLRRQDNHDRTVSAFGRRTSCRRYSGSAGITGRGPIPAPTRPSLSAAAEAKRLRSQTQ